MHTRLRAGILAAIATVTTLAVTSAAGAATNSARTTASASTPASTSAPAAPKVGECRDYGWTASEGISNTSSVVSCSARHTARVIKIAQLPQGTTWATVPSKATAAADRACRPALWRILGSTASRRDRSAYQFTYFAPTKAQFQAGARWVRCDVTLAGNNKLLALPTNKVPFIGDKALNDTIARCLTSQPGLTSCSMAHTWRSSAAFTFTHTGYPTRAQFLHAAGSRCVASAGADWYASWQMKVGWQLGDHVVVCYRRTTK